MRMTLIVLAAVLLQTTSVHAQSTTRDAENSAMQAALESRNDFVKALQNKDFTELTHQGFDNAVQALAEQIRTDQHDDAMADELLAQWNQSSAFFEEKLAERLADKDLGDHDPLFPWLKAFIEKLGGKYGSIIMSLPIVKNVMTLNYAIPVVFAPRGHWQQDLTGIDLRIEYRKHFIPFANLVTYYVTLYGCKYVLHQHGLDSAKKLCDKAATKLEFVMGRYIAPVVSDWIYKQTNRSIQITDSQLHYNSVDDLRQAIQH